MAVTKKPFIKVSDREIFLDQITSIGMIETRGSRSEFLLGIIGEPLLRCCGSISFVAAKHAELKAWSQDGSIDLVEP